MIEKILKSFKSVLSILKLFNLEKTSETAIKRKNEIYLPILKAVEEVNIDLNSKNFETIMSDFIENVVDNNYRYLIDENLLKSLKLLLEYLSEYNNINEIIIAQKIIIDSFEHGFSDLYGYIIEGYSLHYDEIHDCEYELEEIVEERLYFNVDCDFIINLLKNRKCLDRYYHYDMNQNVEEIFVNPILVDFYESTLTNNRKVQLEEWEDERGLYIAYYYDFNKQYDAHEQIKLKNSYKDKVINQIDIIINQIQVIISKMVKVHEKKLLKY